MATELFSSSEMSGLSPRLQWIKKHRLQIERYNEDGKIVFMVYKHDGLDLEKRDGAAYGSTEDDALREWAIKRRLLLWNEEGMK